MNKRDKAKSDRRRLIVEAAIDCFIAKGIHQTGIRDIATRANVSLGNLYNHFTGKDALIAEIAALEGRDVLRFVEAIRKPENPLEGIVHFARVYLDHASQPAVAALAIEMLSVALRNPGVAEAFDANRARLIDALCAAMRDGVAAGSIRSDIDQTATANLILDSIEGLGLRMAMIGKKPDGAVRTPLLKMIQRSLAV